MKRGPILESPANETLPLSVLANLLDLIEQPILLSDRTGRILLANARGEQQLQSYGVKVDSNSNLFTDVLRVSPKEIVEQIEAGEQQVNLDFGGRSGKALARIECLAEADWIVVRIEGADERNAVLTAAATQHTLQE